MVVGLCVGHDSLFYKYDPLRALCEQASQAGLAVYAVTPELSGNADWEAALARMQKKYAVAGLYVEGSALFDSISRQAVFYADEAAFNDPSSLFLASLDTDGFHGAVFDYVRCRAQPEAFSVLASALDGSAARPALLEYTPGGTLAVSYPADGAAVYTSACFVMGTSDPAQELLLNGTPVESRGPGGTFGVLVDVAEGQQCVYPHTGRNQRLCDREPARARRRRSGGTTEVPHDDHCGSGAGHADQLRRNLCDGSSDADRDDWRRIRRWLSERSLWKGLCPDSWTPRTDSGTRLHGSVHDRCDRYPGGC